MLLSLLEYLGKSDLLIKLTNTDNCRYIYGWFSDNFNFCCIICLYFGISNFKIHPVYTSSSKYIFPDLSNNNAQFGIFTSFWRLFFCKSEHKLSSPSHTCLCLQKINWWSYLHTKTAKMLQKWQYKSHPKKKNSMHRLYWNMQHSFQNFPKKLGRVRQFFIVIQMPKFHWYYCLCKLLLWYLKKHYQATNYKIESL